MPHPPVRASAVFYLHGFASSPRSTKVQYFTQMLAERGTSLQCPDLNEPDFRTLTMTRMLDQLQARSWARIREARAAALEKSR